MQCFLTCNKDYNLMTAELLSSEEEKNDLDNLIFYLPTCKMRNKLLNV